MSIRVRIAVAIAALLAAGGCARSAKVATVHVEQPGTHVVSTSGAITIARNDGANSRVCTRVVPQSGKKRGGKAGPAALRPNEPGAHLDVLLFRLCEARGNGDISAEQYASSVQTIMKTMEAMATRPHAPMAPRMGPGQGWRRRGFGPGGEGSPRRRGGPGRWTPEDDDPEPPVAPEPPNPKKGAP
jgi:hypothetical protein